MNVFESVKEGQTSKKIWQVIAICFGLVFFAQFIAAWLQPLLVILSAMIWGTIDYAPSLSILQGISLIDEIGAFAAVILWISLAEGRSFSTLGYFKEKAVQELGRGLLLGLALVTLALLIVLPFTPYQIGLNKDIPLSFLALITYFFAYQIWAGASMLIFQGYALPVLNRYHKKIVALLISSLLWVFFAAFNSTLVAPMYLLNEFLFALLLGLVVLWRKNLWTATALFATWHFVTESLLGVTSRNAFPSPSYLQITFSGNTFLTGGELGLTYSVAVSFVLLAASAFLAWKKVDWTE